MSRISSILLASTLTAVAVAHPGHAPAIDGKGLDQQVRTGNGMYTFDTVPGWSKFPDGKPIGPTHGGIAVGKDGRVYVSTDSERGICVFSPSGAFEKSMALDCKGTHALTMREEGGTDVLYGAHLAGNRIVKLDLDGKLLLQIPNDKTGIVAGGWGGLTGVAVAPDGTIFAAMGYGSNLIHQFDADGRLLKTIGGPGKGDGQFQTCHGIAVDSRFDPPRLLVADRENRRLVHLAMDGSFIGVASTFLRRPCAISIRGDLAAVAELEGRVTLIDKNGTPVAFLGDNPKKGEWANFGVAPEAWKEGIFTAPHGVAWDADGNLYVQDWNATGRVTRLNHHPRPEGGPALYVLGFLAMGSALMWPKRG